MCTDDGGDRCRSPDNLMRITMSRSFIPLGMVSTYRVWVDFTANPTLACLGSFSSLPIQKTVYPAPFSISCESSGFCVSLRAVIVMSYLANSLPMIAVILSS